MCFICTIPWKNYSEPIIISGGIFWYSALIIQLIIIVFLCFYEYKRINISYERVKFIIKPHIGYVSCIIILVLAIINNLLLGKAISQGCCIYFFFSLQTLLYSIITWLIIIWVSFFITFTIVYIILSTSFCTNNDYWLIHCSFFKKLQRDLLYDRLFTLLDLEPGTQLSNPLWRFFFLPYWAIFYTLSFFFSLSPRMYLLKDASAFYVLNYSLTFYNKLIFSRRLLILQIILVVFLLLVLLVILPEILWYELHNPISEALLRSKDFAFKHIFFKGEHFSRLNFHPAFTDTNKVYVGTHSSHYNNTYYSEINLSGKYRPQYSANHNATLADICTKKSVEETDPVIVDRLENMAISEEYNKKEKKG